MPLAGLEEDDESADVIAYPAGFDADGTRK